MDYYDVYFNAQTGGGGRTGYGGISSVYVGSPNQRGHGIGSFLGGLFRRILPFLKAGAQTVGKEVLRTGVNAAQDIITGGLNPREAFKSRLRESGKNLKRKAEEKISTLMRGSGYKSRKIRGLLHSTGGSATSRIGQRQRGARRRKRTVSGKRVGRVTKTRVSAKTGRRKKTARKGRSTRGKTGRRSGLKKKRTVADIFA